MKTLKRFALILILAASAAPLVGSVAGCTSEVDEDGLDVEVGE